MNETMCRERARQLEGWTRDLWRSLHRIPELGREEVKTQALVRQTLGEIGIPHRAAGTGVIGEIQGGLPGRTVALRADMDGLPIEEKTGLPYASEHPGRMHACGHDAHTAMLLGAARLLWEARETLPGRVRLLFQPAEESIGGAEPLIAAGAMEGVGAVYALHVAAQAPVGQIATYGGPMYAATDALLIDVIGKSGHGAHPRSGVDAIAIAAQVVTALQTLVSREVEATDAAVVTIGSIHGGKTNNILCDKVELYGTLRTLTPSLRAQFTRRVKELCQGVARAMGGDAAVTVRPGYCACVNDSREARRVLAVAERLAGPEKIRVLKSSSMGGEDFAYYLLKAPGAIYLLGCGSEAPLHNERFALDDGCLPVGVAMHAAVAWAYLTGNHENHLGGETA